MTTQSNRRRILIPLTLWTLLAASTSVMAQATSAAAQAPMPAVIIEKVNAVVDADTARLTAMFKDLHQHPEIGFTETRTAGIVAKELRALGFNVTEGIGKTGVVGVLKNGPGPTVWFRADMDSNSVREATGLPYAATAKQRLADGRHRPARHHLHRCRGVRSSPDGTTMSFRKRRY